MVNKRFMNKSMASAISGIIFSSPILANTNAMETSKVEGVIKTTIETNREENQSIIIERGGVLTEDDFCEIYNIYETNLAKGIELTDNEILTLLVKKINDKENQPSTYAYNILGKNATKEELLLVVKYPTQSVKIFNNSSTASNTASSLYKAETLYLGNGDAFRHAYWNALNVKSVGADIAKAFANAHESETPEGNDKTMDLRNNTVGRNIGRIYSNSSNATIKNKVIEAVNQGRLYRLYNNNIKGKLINRFLREKIKMKKRSIVIIVIIAIISFTAANMLNGNRVTLIINNETSKNIDYLKLNYTGLKKDLDIPVIKSNDNIKYKVDIDNDFREGSMNIYYVDANNKKVKFIVVGYFEKGYKDTINVSIKEINDEIEITTN